MTTPLYDTHVRLADRFRFIDHPYPRRIVSKPKSAWQQMAWEDKGLFLLYAFWSIAIGSVALAVGLFLVWVILTA